MRQAREIAAKTLTRLMNGSRLDTLQRVADKAKIGYGTVRRVKNADVSVTIDNLEAIAGAFGLSLAQFLEDDELTPAQRMCRSAAGMLAELPEGERMQIVNYITLRAELHAVQATAEQPRQETVSEGSGTPRRS